MRKPKDRCEFASHMSCIPLAQNLYDYKRFRSFTLIAGLRRLPICILSIHWTILHSASDTLWYTEKPDTYVPHVFILRSVAVVINIVHSGILCDHVPDFNIDGFNVFSLTSWIGQWPLVLPTIRERPGHIGMTGFEPTTPWTQTKCSAKLSYIPFLHRADDQSRTDNTRITNTVFCHWTTSA